MKKHQILNTSKLFLFTLFALTISANAQTSADLDPDFFGGRVLSRFNSSEQGYSTAIQSDGKIIVAGQTQNGTNGSDFFVARYNTNGVIDRTFAPTAGWTVVNFGTGFNEVAPDVAIAPDGKIVVAGRTCANPCSTPRIAVAQFTSNGFLDTAFSIDGLATASVGVQSYGYSVAVQSDGKIVVTGDASGTGVAGNGQGDPANTVIFRFALNGNLDATFDGDGIVTTDFFPANQSNSDMRAIAIQADGKIVVGGNSNSLTGSPGDDNFALARYNSNGTLDTTFSGDGMIVLDISTSFDHLRTLAIHDNGKIVVSGEAFIGGNYDVALVQLNSDGTPDNTFGTNGISTTNISGNDSGYAVATQSNGKVVVAGDYNDTSSRFVARYNANGTLDNSFDGDGINSSILFRSPEPTQSFRGLALQSDGKPVVVGTSTSNLAIARLTINGTLDGTFGNRAIARSEGNEVIRSLALQTDGKIVAAGYSIASGNRDFMVKRFTADGRLDMSFAVSGSISFGFGTTSGGLPTSDSAESVKIQSDGKIVLAGFGADGFCQLGRLDTNGNLDNTFSGDGLVRVQMTLNQSASCDAGEIQSDGKIIASGYGVNGGNSRFATFRFNIDGTLDSSFGSGGIVTSLLLGTSYDVAVQTDGKIIVAGRGTSPATLTLFRYNVNGTLDTTFSGDGIVTTDIVVPSTNSALSMKIQSDGKIVTGFPVDLTPLTTFDLDFGLVRFNSDGSIDNSFGTSGIVTTDFGSTLDMLSEVLIQSTGKIVAVGNAPLGSYAEFAMARYNTDGSLDTTFDLTSGDSLIGDGKVMTDVGGFNDYAYAAVIQPDDKIIAGGYSSVPNANAFSLVRYRGAFAPLAANVSVSGRVLTKNGNGIRNAVLTLLDANGATHTARTGAFGYYHFDEIPTGTVIISVHSKRFTFTNPTQVIGVTDNIDDFDWTAIE